MRRALAVLVGLLACCVLAGAVVVGPVAGQSTSAANGTVDACTVVDEPGEYDLVGDVASNESASCIAIQSSDVVLDGNGHAVEGPAPSSDDGSPAAGILVDGDTSMSYENVTVEDVTVSGFDAGVQAGSGGSGDDTAVDVVNVDVTDAGRGILLRGGNATLSSVTVEDGEVGVDADGAGAVEFFDVVLSGNGDGLNAAETGPIYAGSTTIETNDGAGVTLGPAVSMDADGLQVTGNGGVGIDPTGQDTSVSTADSDVSDNGESGVVLGDGAEATLDETVVSGNGADGVRVNDGGSVTLYDVTAGDNGGWELDARGGTAYARGLQVAPSTSTSFNSGPVALEPVAREDLPAPPENRTFVGDGLNVTASEMGIGMTFDVEGEDAVEAWRHDGDEWVLEGEVPVENGTAEKYNGAVGIFAPAVVDDSGSESGDETATPTPTATPTDTESASDSDDASPDVDVSGGGIHTAEETPTPTPNATATPTVTATATPTATATATENASDGTSGDGVAAAQADDESDDADDEESGFAIADGPGFGVVAAVLALLAGTLLAHRRR
jgi:PGF-CTERM protein